MRKMGIDQSYTNTGIVILDDDPVFGSKIVLAERFKTDKKKDIFYRAWQVSEHLLATAQEYKPSVIGMEGLAFGMRGNATRDLAGLQFVVATQLKFVGQFDLELVSPKAVKKFATRDGSADKETMVNSLPEDVRKRFLDLGAKKTTGLYDLTDAYYIALMMGQ